MTADALSWEAAGDLTGLIEARRSLLSEKRAGLPQAPYGPSGPHRSPRTAPGTFRRSHTEAWTRRRRLASSGPLPPSLAAAFTTGELAALRIVLDEVRDRGRCERTLGELGTRAGVSIDTARRAIRAAARMGLITIEERRRYRAPSLPHLIRVVSQEVLSWIKKASRSLRMGEGSKMQRPTDKVGIRRARFIETQRSGTVTPQECHSGALVDAPPHGPIWPGSSG